MHWAEPEGRGGLQLTHSPRFGQGLQGTGMFTRTPAELQVLIYANVDQAIYNHDRWHESLIRSLMFTSHTMMTFMTNLFAAVALVSGSR